MALLLKVSEDEGDDCDPYFTVCYSTDQRTPITQPQINYLLTIMPCVIILPLVILYSAAAAASGADNGRKPHDKGLSSVIIYYSSFHPLFVRD